MDERAHLQWASIAVCLCLSCTLIYSIGDVAAAKNEKPKRQIHTAVTEGFNFLYRQMDRYHYSMIVFDEPEFSNYYPSGYFGDVAALSVRNDHESCYRDERNCLRIDYEPSKGAAMQFAGLYFLYPDNNWGKLPGRNVSGASKLSFWVKSNRLTIAKFIVGGVNRPRQSGLAYSDSFGPVSTDWIPIDEKWTPYEIDLDKRDLSSVIGAFGVVLDLEHDSEPRTIFLDNVAFNLARADEPRFLQSYLPFGCDLGAAPNMSHVYDQSLALLALLARGLSEDLVRAELIAQALLLAQQNDRKFSDGRLRNAYASGEVVDPHFQSARLPGQWNAASGKFFEDEFAVGADVGNMAWAGLALVQAHKLLPRRDGNPYLIAALDLAAWIVRNTKVEDELGGFRGGFEGFENCGSPHSGQSVSMWRSTEHNIDLVALFEHLAQAVGYDTVDGQYWRTQAKHAGSFVHRMWNTDKSNPHLWTGAQENSFKPNTSVIPLDTQTWAVLGMGEPGTFERALDWALANCQGKDDSHSYDFNCRDGDGAWWEGTAQVAAALNVLDRENEAALIIESLQETQLQRGREKGAIPAASKCGLTTGFLKTWRSTGEQKPWLYSNEPHVGATSWFLLAAMGQNPYYLRPPQ